MTRRLAAVVAMLVIVGLNSAPRVALAGPFAVVAAADSYATDEDTALSVDAPGVLANDTPEGIPCVSSSDDSGLDGTLAIASDGSFTFEPNDNFHGETTFTYSIAANVAGCTAEESSATVTITVNPANDPPAAQADAFQFVWNQTLNIGGPGVLSNDSDVDHDGLTALKVSNPSHGTLTLAADGGFSYTPAASACPGQADAFSYRASDGTAQSAVRTVFLNPAPLPCPTVAPTSTPTPTPTATPTPTPEPTASPTAELTPSPSLEETPIDDPSFSVDPSEDASASPSPAATQAPGTTSTGGGGLSLPVLLVIVLFVVLLAFGAAVTIPKWLRSQQAGEPMDVE